MAVRLNVHTPVCLLRRPLACSWSLSPLTTPRQLLRSFYIAVSRARRTSSSIWLSLLVFSLSLCVSVSRRFSSLPALSVSSLPTLCSCLWSCLWSLLSSLSAFCSLLCRRSVLVSAPLLSHLCLGYASRSSRGLLQYYSTSDKRLRDWV